MEITKTSLRGFRIFALLTLLLAAATIVLSCISLGTMGEVYGVAPAAGDIITYLYQIHGFFALFLGLMAFAFLFLHRKREMIVKICVWGMMILGIMHVTPFFTNTVFYLGSASFGEGLNYFSAYLPALMISVICIALLSNWMNPDPYVVNRTSLVCSLVSVFMCIVYLVQASALLSLTSTLHDNAQIWGLICGNLGLTVACVFIWILTWSRRRFERLMYDMSDRQATAYEIVDQRVDKEARRIEQEVNAALSLHGPLFGDKKESDVEEVPLGPVGTEDIPVTYVRPEPEPAPTPTPVSASEPEVESAPARRSRFIPASENLYGELPLQHRPRKSSPSKTKGQDW